MRSSAFHPISVLKERQISKKSDVTVREKRLDWKKACSGHEPILALGFLFRSLGSKQLGKNQLLNWQIVDILKMTKIDSRRDDYA